MAVSRQDVLQVAALARLRLSEDEVERFTVQLNGILAHVEELMAVDIEGVEAVGGAAEWSARLREESEAPDGLSYSVAAMAPSWEDGFFTVPRIAALDASAMEEPFEDKARLDSAGRPDPEDLPGGAA